MSAVQALPHDVLLLMLNLSQSQDPERIIQLFLEGINSRELGVSLRWVEVACEPTPNSEEIATQDSHFGHITFEGDLDALPPDVMPVLRNAVRMLALVLENRQQARALAEERRNYQRTVEERNEVMFRTAIDGFWAIDTEGNILEVNDAFCAMTGYRRDELLAMRVRDVEAEETPEEISERILHIREAGGQRFETRHRRKDGVVIDVEASANYLDHSGGRLLAFFRDITERKRAEEELQKLAAAVKHSGELVNLSTLEGRMVFLNEAGGRMLGIDPQDVEHVNIMDVIPEHCVELVESDLLPTLMRGDIWEGDLQYRNLQTGHLTDVHAMTFTVKDPNTNEPQFLANVSMDITERKRVEEAMRRFEHIVSSSTDMLALLDKNYVYLSANEAYLKAFSKKYEEVIGLKVADVFGKEFFEVTIRPRAERCLAGEEVRYQDWFEFPNSGRRYMDIAYFPYVDADGETRGFVVCGRDITEHKRAEEAMRASEEHYKNFFDNALVGLFRTRLSDGMFIDINSRSAEQLGLPIEDIVEKTRITDFYRNRDQRRELISRLKQDGEVHGFEVDLTLRDGRDVIFSVSAKAYPDEDYMEGAVIDITDRKRAEAERERLTAIIEATSDFVSTSTPDNRIIYVNQAGRKMIGWGRDEDPRKRVIADAHPAWAIRIVEGEGIPAAIEHGVWQGETAVLAVDGREIPASQVIMSHKSPTGELEYLSTIIRDISDRKRTEEELKKYRDHLEELVKVRTFELESEKMRAESADRMKSVFLATMSHELRTPLNAVIGFTGIILQRLSGPLTDEQEDQLGMVDSSARHLLTLINDVLDLSKIEAGQLEVSSERYDINEVIMQAVKSVAHLADEKGLTLTSDISVDASVITGDPRRVEQVILNLLYNAIKFTAKGSIVINCRSTGTEIEISIKDTGIGIKPEDINKLFNPFQQIDSSMVRQYAGTGLGLSICKKMVVLMGGKITVLSRWGEGSTFSFTLPLKHRE